ncbi:LysM peptidoglycan-binding domain-containing protein [Geobacter argillaceus]|uniref:LysM domain-containing protein n=1 Tax=Geobacter argillaceus TaxID=345631 RepID=A0A562W8F5_9BACT|nr:LysM peptidoglycan-binding domain-containing protein [Geobacter argillaceus]TWJ26405.1 LysM domain-containing protein [Geobacter argillaceus]
MRKAAGQALLLALILLTLVACSEQLHSWRPEARTAIEIARGKGGKTFFPEEFADLENAFRQGELLLSDDEEEDAEQFYLLALTKGKLLTEQVDAERVRREEAKRQQREAAQRAADRERQEREAAEERRREQEREASRLRAVQAEARAEAERKTVEKTRQHPLAATHTVKRGESLPQIAAQPDVYNDAALWPLLYRANRDQIRDPRIVWPGQVLHIPRNFGRDDMAEARRYNQEHPIH